VESPGSRRYWSCPWSPPSLPSFRASNPYPSSSLPFTGSTPPRQLQAARDPVTERVREIFETARVRVRWEDANGGLGSDAIAVVLIPDPPRPPYVPARTLGVTSVPHRRFVYVFFNPVVRAVGLAGPVRALSSDEEMVFWRALSRVISHEIVHSLVPGEQHAASGIMSEELTPFMLQRGRLELVIQTKCQIRRPLRQRSAASSKRIHRAPARGAT